MKADFSVALVSVLASEGGYVNDPLDSGGETYRGISRRSWPEWHGWAIIDRLRFDAGFPASLASDHDLQQLVVGFYRRFFWLAVFERMPQMLANKMMSFAVVAGMIPAVKGLQAALNACGKTVDIDGKLGPLTERAMLAVNSANADSLLCAMRSEMACHFRMVAQRRPKDQRFLRGWLRRAWG